MLVEKKDYTCKIKGESIITVGFDFFDFFKNYY